MNQLYITMPPSLINYVSITEQLHINVPLLINYISITDQLHINESITDQLLINYMYVSICHYLSIIHQCQLYTLQCVI